MDSVKRLTRRRLLGLSGVAIGAAALAACGATPTPQVVEKEVTKIVAGTPEVVKETVIVKETQVVKETVIVPATAPPGKTVITYMTTPTMVEMEEAAYQDFMKANPDVKVEAQYVGGGVAYEKLLMLGASGDLPDIYIVFAGWVREFERHNMTLDLAPAIEKEYGALDPNKYSLNILDAVRTGSSILALPWQVQSTFLFYNKTLFDAAKVPLPDETWTYDTVHETAKALTKTDSSGNLTQWGVAVAPDYQSLEPAIHGNGGTILSDDQKSCTFDSQVNRDTVQFFVDLIHKDKVAPLPSDIASSENGQVGLIASGKLAMAFDGGWAVDTLRGQKEFEWGMMYQPTGKVSKWHIFWPDSRAIAKNCKHISEAVRLLFHLTGLGGNPYTIPFVKSIMDTKDWLQTDKPPEKRAEIEQNAVFKFGHPGDECSYKWWPWYQAWVSELQFAFIGERDVPTSVKAATKAVQDILNS